VQHCVRSRSWNEQKITTGCLFLQSNTVKLINDTRGRAERVVRPTVAMHDRQYVIKLDLWTPSELALQGRPKFRPNKCEAVSSPEGHPYPSFPLLPTHFPSSLSYDTMSGYSSIFSAGLLATPRPEGHTTYGDYSTPSRHDGSTNMDSDSDTTPTKSNAVPSPSSEDVVNYFLPRSRASSNASATSPVVGCVVAPRLRRRRSSLSIANNGMGAVKSPQRNAGIALQRTALMSPGGRARSGSTDIRPVDLPCIDREGHGVVPSRVGGGRSRSGSMGGAMR
jgi:hypothetical protein